MTHHEDKKGSSRPVNSVFKLDGIETYKKFVY